MREIEGGITAIDGFTAGGMFSGIKKTGRPDLAMIFSEQPSAVAGVFTKNQFPAPPLLLDRLHLRGKRGQAIIVNSGNANAFTGRRGYQDAEAMAKETARALGIPLRSVYVASTGVISEFLPIEKIQEAIPRLALSLSKEGGRAAAEAIMTTDTFSKETAWVGAVGQSKIRVGGIAKGSGMIHPNMATMLAFLATDVSMTPALLQEGLRQAVDRSFHQITVDGDTSTNDMVLLFSNGMKGKEIRTKGKAYREFASLLETACRSLAKMIVKDGEGATKFIEIEVTGATSDQAARRIAFSIARSSLVKTAFFGEDANWGRIIAAIGNAGIRVDPNKLDLSFTPQGRGTGGPVTLVRGGNAQGKEAEAKVAASLKQREIHLILSLHSGKGKSTVWTSDLSLDYVKINASYRT